MVCVTILQLKRSVRQGSRDADRRQGERVKIWKCYILTVGYLNFFPKSEMFPKIWNFSENLKFFRKSENFRKSKIFPKSEVRSSLWSHVSRVTSLWDCSTIVSKVMKEMVPDRQTNQQTDNWTYRAVRWQLKNQIKSKLWYPDKKIKKYKIKLNQIKTAISW